MRSRVILLLSLLLLSAMPVSGEVVEATILEDDRNDVVITNADGSVQQNDGGQMPNVDLVAVGVLSEDDDQITFFIEVAGMDDSSQNPAPFHDPDYAVYFNYGEQGYRVFVATALQNAVNDGIGRSGEHFARLEIQSTETSFRALADAEVEVDSGDDRIMVSIPRRAILDENQAPLGIDRTLTNIWAEAQSGGWFQFPVGQTQQGGEPLFYAGGASARDQAPDELTGALPTYTMSTGPVRARGGLVAGSDDPVRWTNGEASTLVFQVAVTNTDDRDIPVTVDIENADSTWTMAYSDSLTVPRQSFVNVTFLVSIPFSHNHGAMKAFEATFSEVNGEAFAAADLGVYWPAVPQPAGHHDTIWLHSLTQSSDNPFEGAFNSGVHGWMSAIEDEDQDESVPIPSMFTVPPNTFTGGSAISYWGIGLEPELRMGLDFRPDENGIAEITINFPSTVIDPVLHYELSHIEVGERQGRNDNGIRKETTLATASTPPISGPVSGSQGFELDLDIDQAADEIPYKQQVNLRLELVLEATFIGGFGNSDPASIAPQLIPGSSWMKLPLNEYVAPLDISFQTDGNLDLTVGPEGVQRYVNPGKTTVYTFDLAYHGSNATTLRASLSGPNAEWAHIVGDETFDIPAQETRTIGFAVTAPSGARAGERADLTLSIVDVDNAAVQTGINTITTVATDEDIPDESHRAEDLDAELTSDKDSPGLGLIVLLGAIFLARRRS